jgi:VIT1/CCC1 family predicted Fe2+/Mn2+ transporter
MIDRKPQGNRAQLARFFMALGLPGLARSLNRNAPAQSANNLEMGQGNELRSSELSPDQRKYQELLDRRFLLQVVQPGLAGLMDGSVSTLAPIFAAAFATRHPMTAFLVGMAAATGAGISMAFSEALSDDGVLTGRGNPIMRGAITGFMTFLGGAGHTLPFLVPDFRIALAVAFVVVGVELVLIAAIRHRFFGTRWLLSMLQVVGGGILVIIAGLIFGNV